MSESSSTDRDEPLRKTFWALEVERNKNKTARKHFFFFRTPHEAQDWPATCMLFGKNNYHL